ncbi:type III-A CRISPR-associated RAMP protein Csm5 [Acidaminococcus sp. NSJ-142]|jgi:CRISPR-associated protein Csm5|uniref:type III-A CRISPR-associated RAMP protein Csm5 n=1 Tax=Acidaminococcus TaxID=904 RepID=UPI001E548D86|nr:MULTISPECIES: type III-A CRISPR-associated RAMP protein Csm5 [Acidaminococcus]MCD2435783.1 type III-A CRISPR-associated RAMP protein Csm5 [Acidaminococcus hominis]MCH4097496.1 type III-A CRISPR-associated RAMP protein Csm5 [Acidaminococcus provencensis]
MHNSRNDFLEQSTLRLQVLTPVSIGAGHTLNSKEYLYDRSRGKIYLLNQKEWFKYLYGKKLLPFFERYLQENSSETPFEWLEKTMGSRNVNPVQLGKAIRTSMEVQVDLKKSGIRKNVNDIIPCLHQADGTVYIPGSSLKGLLRTAILFHLIRQEKWESRRKAHWQEIQKIVPQLERASASRDGRGEKSCIRELEKIAAQIERELLCVLGCDEKNAPLNDALRGLRCGDALLVRDKAGADQGKSPTALLQKVDLGQRGEKALPIFFEAIMPGTQFEFSLTLEKSMLERIGIHSIAEVEQILQEFYQYLNKVLQEAFPNQKSLFAELAKGNAYLGRNNGFLHKTFVLALADSPRETVPVVRAVLNKEFWKHKHLEADRTISPRLLKGTRLSNRLVLMGGVRISRV